MSKIVVMIGVVIGFFGFPKIANKIVKAWSELGEHKRVKLCFYPQLFIGTASLFLGIGGVAQQDASHPELMHENFRLVFDNLQQPGIAAIFIGMGLVTALNATIRMLVSADRGVD